MAQDDRWLTLGGSSSGALANRENRNCPPQAAAAHATVLFGCYRASEANDPEIFMAAATAVLSAFPERVVMAVCDPRGGIASRSKWLPAIAEIREACEAAWRQELAMREREARITAQLEARERRVESGERERVARGLAALASELGGGRRVNRTEEIRSAEEKLVKLEAVYRATPLAPCPLIAEQMRAERTFARAVMGAGE